MDFSNIKEDFRKEIVRGGEAYIDGQVRIATSADGRASSLAGMFTAAATALTAGVIALTPAWSVPGHVSLMIGGGASAILFLIGACLCIFAIQPVGFWLALRARKLG
jgi:hypothetical protein